MAGNIADFSNLVELLQEQQDQYLLTNPYYLGAAGIAKAGSTAGYDMPAWQKLLAGAVAGLGGGFLKGVGERQAEEKSTALSEAFAKALETPADQREALYDANPDLRKMGGQIELAEKSRDRELKDYIAKEKQKQLITALMEPPKTRDRIDGVNTIQEERNPLTGEWSQFGAGPRSVSSAEPPLGAQPVNAELLNALVGKGQIDPNVASTIRTNNDLQSVYRGMTLDMGQQGIDIAAKKTNLPGYDKFDDSVILESKTVGDYRTKIAATQNARSKLEQLATKDLSQLTGQDTATQRALASSLFNSFRNLTGSGAALSAGEVSIINDMIPALQSGDFVEAMKRGALGRDQKVFAKDVSKLLQDDLDTELFALGFKSKAKDFSAYSPSLRETMGVKLPPNVSTAASPTSGGSLGAGTPAAGASVAPRLPGETPTQYRQRTGL